ncbi:disintegrin and metalloproteinase domain-containing protein 32 isoform X1 [Erinaceus europaeus]|uniref:Disintegrin and metalloproteinase domain-containing protein 32 isoform X1 n=1 Tax=Erinaceus europaeus TaxID=9365 RepID=A0ABM3WNT7_ERIEU|nr:disintegrin and metalloproteinase domain-containing protein 32 isoform X1 [Erinaceus europaeus]
MLLPVLLLAGLRGLLATGPDFQDIFLQIITPEKIQANINDSEVENEEISYIIPVDGKQYTIYLKKRYFLSENFMVYLYNQGSMKAYDSETQCYYQGYVEGYTNSIVILSTCSGLRGILQFENVSYGIEPLESTIEFQHVLYKLKNKNNDSALLTSHDQGIKQNSVNYVILLSKKSQEAGTDLRPLYLEMHIVVDKVLYDYLGSDSMVATSKIIEVISLVNSMFAQFKVTIVLSSLELWSDENKISTDGEADELLNKFIEWKKSYLTLRPHDIAYLFIYRDHPNNVGATFPGKMCVTHYSAGIALYTKEMTLEAFSVIVTQIMGLSLGIAYDEPMKCQCSGALCIMNPNAMQFSGVKTFSNCSLSDFENFISNMGTRCLQNKPQMQKAPAAVCGNGKVEGKEQCDCGNEEQCGPDSCCDFRTCVLKHGAQCATGLCCKRDCKFQSKGFECRPRAHPECDFPEFCNGSSAKCEPDVTVHNGHLCKHGKHMCFGGNCQDSNAQCEAIFGKGSRAAPFQCYEEIHAQTGRFGNCGINNKDYVPCRWRNFRCGRLICTYPTRIPFYKDNVAVMYAYVRDIICVTIDFRVPLSAQDPMAVRSGTYCDKGKICVNRQCVDRLAVEKKEQACSQTCSGHGVCNSLLKCHCFDGFQPPTCKSKTRAYSEVPEKQGLLMENVFRKTKKSWSLLSVYIVLPGLVIAIIIFVSWNRLKKWFVKEEESLSSKSEPRNHTDTSRSEVSNKTDTSSN